jgi:threonine/homoserine efflux transporter RhtA
VNFMKQKTDVDWARVARWAVAVAVYLVGCIFVVPYDERQWTWQPTAVLLAAGAVFWLLKLKAERERKRRTDAAELRAEVGR